MQRNSATGSVAAANPDVNAKRVMAMMLENRIRSVQLRKEATSVRPCFGYPCKNGAR
uniref:Uncharacterized protein n=1 Tax=Ralstonia solanacearum TaxID=305 RepID=A0A0S4VCL7_RALSL|nr:protein of unknown function [Ralstonia solanacearum]CUV32384.1 protein of unknown function [Ralstonia solanacearum]CUV38864.1 protein of unknown function [Ralstonia solanacearum]CUV63769.1 protein of unknown function [Ralstonia solanacearum]